MEVIKENTRGCFFFWTQCTTV